MDATSAPAIDDVIAHIVGDVAEAVSTRLGETQQQQADRAQTAELAIMTLQPRNAVEAMIAGRCVMLHDVMVHCVRGLLRGEAAATNSNILAMDKAIANNLLRLERYQEAQDAPASGSAPAAEPVTPETTDPAPADSSTGTSEPWPTATQIAGFNRQTRRAFDRQVRKRINQAVQAASAAGVGRPAVTSSQNGPATTTSATPAG